MGGASREAVCVSDASTWIGQHVASALRDAGHDVRPGPGAPGDAAAWEAALASCTALVLTGCTDGRDADAAVALVDAALTGVERAASVERVVLTSDLGAITDAPEAGRVFDESDWNERSSPHRMPGAHAATEVERAAWRHAERGRGWSLVALHPGTLIGPGPTRGDVVDQLVGGELPAIFPIDWALVDVRDVAAAHVAALERRELTGRFALVGEVLAMKDLVGLVRAHAGSAGLPTTDLTGRRGAAMIRMFSHSLGGDFGARIRTHLGVRLQIDTSRARALGVAFRPVAATLADRFPSGEPRP
ncbi:MAG: hypothetical protein H6737_13810 [Alphaproteobacteria bacterium]|nr:hypothetical protein [Alphaproteobacteria bacterium]